MMKASDLGLSDGDGNTLQIVKVVGYSEPMLCVTVTQEDDECSMNLNAAQAKELIAHLQNELEDFLER